MKSFTKLVESMLTTPSMPTWSSSSSSSSSCGPVVATPGLAPVSTWGWGHAPLDV